MVDGIKYVFAYVRAPDICDPANIKGLTKNAETAMVELLLVDARAQTSSFGAGEGDAFVACLASNGGHQWFRTIEGTGPDLGNGIAVYGDSIYITGPSEERFRRFNNAFVAKLGLEYISSQDPWDMEWTSDEQCPPICVDGANPSVTAPTPTVDSHSPTVQTQSPTITSHTLTISQQYPETHTAVPKEDVTPLEDLDVTLLTVSLSIDPSQPDTTQTATFTVTAHDNTGGIGIAEIRIYVDYAAPAKIWTTPGTYTYTGGPYTREPVDLHVYWVEAVDYAGNLAREQGTFTVSASPMARSPQFPWEWVALAVSVIGAVATLTFVIVRRRTGERPATSSARDVELSWTETNDRIGKIDLTFTMPRNYSAKERMMLERAADACPIKHSFHPDTKISVHYNYPE